MEKSTKALVKGVQSGDCIILSGKIPKNPSIVPDEYIIHLTGVSAPKCGNTNNLDGEPFSFHAKEYLRKKLVGKVVTYHVDFTNNERWYGQITYDGANIAEDIVQKGFAKLGFIPKGHDNVYKTKYWEGLQQAEEEAKSKKSGIWNKDELWKHKKVLHNINEESFDMNWIKDAIKNKTELTAIVEYVFNCAFYSVFINEFNAFAKMNLRFVGIPNNKDQILVKTGKAYAERMSWHHDAKIKIYALEDGNKNIIGDIIVEKGNLAGLVLKEGYTKMFISTSVPFTADESAAMKAHQDEAKKNRLRMWKNETAQESPELTKDESDILGEVKCYQVHSGDSLSIVDKNGEILRIFLSNVKAPTLAKPNTIEQDQPWAFHAKEFLRKNLVGKIIRCEYDYTKTIQKDNRKMKFYTIYYKSDTKKAEESEEKCINVDLIECGYANIATFKIEEGEASKELDAMRAMEASAKEKKRGWYSPKSPGISNYSDLISANKSKKKDFTSFLTGLSDCICTVEYCFSGAKFKLRIEKKQCMIPISMIGVKTFTKDKNNTDLVDKYFNQALNYVNDVLLQRDGVCDIVAADRVGNYFGHFLFNGKNFGITLIKKGLAVVNEHSNNPNPYITEMRAAEKEAEKNKVGIWENEGLVHMLKNGENSMFDNQQYKFETMNKDVNLRVSEYIDFHKFFVNIVPNNTLNKIENVLDTYNTSPKKCINLELPIKKGTLCAARYSSDGRFYRAIINGVTKEQKYEVEFIDYGTVDYLSQTELIKLDGAISSFEPQCLYCELAYLKYSQNSMTKLLTKFPDFVNLDLEWKGKILYTYNSEGRTKSGVVIYKKGTDIASTYHADFLQIGFSKLDRTQQLPACMKELDTFEKKASSAGVGLWAENEETDYDVQDEDDNVNY